MGNTAIVITPPKAGSIEELKAQVASFEANPVAPDAPNTPSETTVAAATPQEKAALPKPEPTPPIEEKAKPAQQPQETPEKVASEPPKAAEPEKITDWKAAYKGLQQKFNKAFVEKKAEPKEETKPPVVSAPEDEIPADLTPEFIKLLETDSETKNPWIAVDRLVRARLQQTIAPVKSKLDAVDSEKRNEAQLKGLETLAETNPWLKTPEGMQKMADVFAENPELWKTKDPYRAALGFISDVPSNARQSGPAQSTGSTPMLGVAGAVPPVVSTPAASNEDALTKLMQEMNTFLSRGDVKSAKEIEAKMDKITRGY